MVWSFSGLDSVIVLDKFTNILRHKLGSPIWLDWSQSFKQEDAFKTVGYCGSYHSSIWKYKGKLKAFIITGN